MFKIETHVHTSETSPCSNINATELITGCRNKGFSTVIITDHFTEKSFSGLSPIDIQNRFLKGYDTASLCGDKLGVTVLLGAEIRFTNSKEDYLIYGINRSFAFTHSDIFNKDVRYLREELTKIGNPFLIVQAHPGRPGHECKYHQYIDGIEVFNAMNSCKDMNDRAKEYCEQYHKLPFSGTDCHKNEVLGVGGLICNRPIKTMRDFIEVVSIGNYELIRNN